MKAQTQFLGSIAAGATKVVTINVPKPISHFEVTTTITFGTEAVTNGVAVSYQVAYGETVDPTQFPVGDTPNPGAPVASKVPGVEIQGSANSTVTASSRFSQTPVNAVENPGYSQIIVTLVNQDATNAVIAAVQTEDYSFLL
jgi:hypothetical protein